MFSFRGRMPRLSYFLQGFLALPLAAGVCAFIFTLLLAGPLRHGNKAAGILCIGLIAVGAILLLWLTLAMQTKRLRDMGWDPLIVLPGWFAFQCIDAIAVRLYPVYAIGLTHKQSVVSVAVNLFLCGALLLWPSADDEGFSPRLMRDDAPPDDPSADAVQTAPRALNSVPARVTFGRR